MISVVHILILFPGMCGYENQMQSMSWKNSVMLADAVCVCVVIVSGDGRVFIVFMIDITIKLH